MKDLGELIENVHLPLQLSVFSFLGDRRVNLFDKELKNLLKDLQRPS
jgi:hypothetical protein